MKRAIEGEEDVSKKQKTDDGSKPSYVVGPDDCKARFLIDKRSMGLIIGKAGSRIKQLREETGVYASILKVKQNAQTAPDRVLVLQGAPDQVALAINTICKHSIERENERTEAATPSQSTKITVLFDSTQAGAVIGKAGSTIKETQASTGAKMQVSKDPMPSSTERNCIISGEPDVISEALKLVLGQLKEFPVTGTTTEYTPGNVAEVVQDPYRGLQYAAPAAPQGYPQAMAYGYPPQAYGMMEGYGQFQQPPPPPHQQPHDPSKYTSPLGGGGGSQQVVIPTAHVGGVIGKGGRNIRDIKAQTGTNITIADASEDKPGERLATITGTQAGIEQAIALIQRTVEGGMVPSAAPAAAYAAYPAY